MTIPQVDEFTERSRRCSEAQELADDYSRALRTRAFTAFGVAAGCLVLLWLVWALAVSPLPSVAPVSPFSGPPPAPSAPAR